MRRKTVIAIMTSMIIFSGIGFTSSVSYASEDGEPSVVRPTYTALDYVVLGQYTELTVEVEKARITDNDVLTEAEDMFIKTDVVETLTEGVVQEGDTVDISYVGTMNGEEFDGGSGNYDLKIGSGAFIDGFEEGLIGTEVGETIELNLTFPADYYFEDLAGQDVVFTVTVNGILYVPEITDEVVEIATNGEYTSTDSYLAYIRGYLEEDIEDEVHEAVYEAVAAGCEIEELPQELIDYSMNEAIAYYEYYAELLSMEYEDFIESYFGSIEEFETDLEDTVKDSVEEELILMAIAETEKLNLTDKEYKEGLEKYASENGYDSGEDIEIEYGETEMQRYILLDKVYDFLVENNTIEQIADAENETDIRSESGDSDAETDEEQIETESILDGDEIQKTENNVPDFKTFYWGDSKEIVIETEGEPSISGDMSAYDAEYIAYETTVAGMDCILAYYFCDEGLYIIRYLLTEEHSTDSLYIDDYEKLVSGISSKYGEPSITFDNWESDSLEEYYSGNEGKALVYGYLKKTTYWELDDTLITAVASADNYDVTTEVQYESLTISAGEADYSSDF